MKRGMMGLLAAAGMLGILVSGCGQKAAENKKIVDTELAEAVETVGELQAGAGTSENNEEDKNEPDGDNGRESSEQSIGDFTEQSNGTAAEQSERSLTENSISTLDNTVLSIEDDKAGSTDATGLRDWSGTEANPEIVLMENPSWEYYFCKGEENSVASSEPVKLVKLTEYANQITDTEKWFTDHGLTLEPEESGEEKGEEQERFRSRVLPGTDGNEAYCIQVTDTKSGAVCIFNFEQYQYADDFKPQDRDFVKQSIRYAQIKDGIMYVSMGHLTYAESSPHNAYMLAVNLPEKKLLWKSQPLVSNARNFVILEDVILCGYGFTAEPDYIYQLDLASGKVIDRMPLQSMADYLILKDSVLYVRTYNTDYTFEMK